MSKTASSHSIKRHLKLGDYFPATFVTWDENLGKIKLITKLNSKIVHVGTILQLAVITIQIWSVVTKATCLIQRGMGIAIMTLTVIPFLLRFELSADYVPLQISEFHLFHDRCINMFL